MQKHHDHRDAAVVHSNHKEEHGGHSHVPADFGSAFAIGVSANLAYVGLQIIYGLSAHSVALLADAAHNLSDVLGLVLAWGAALSSIWLRMPRCRWVLCWRDWASSTRAGCGLTRS